MAPRGRHTRLNPNATPTPVTPAPTTTTVTEAQLQALIDQGVAAAMAEAKASRVRNGYNSNGSGPRPAQTARECSYSEFLKCKPLDFKGTEGCMTRSSTNKLFTPYKEPEREFRSSRRHFKALSLDELRSLDFNLLSDQEYSEKEEAEAMAKTMEQYMSKTRTDYGSGVSRPKIDNKDQFELKSLGRSTKTSNELAAIQAQLYNLGREIKKVNKKVYVAQVGCGGYRAIASRYYQRNNINPSYQERRQSTEDTLSKFLSESAKRHKENSNLIKEIPATTDASIRNQGASIKTLEI
ncbi:hypothetical protein Tco_1549678 [Tanacetum coccineum]